MNRIKLPSQDYLKEHYEYNELTGDFNKRGKQACKGTVAKYKRIRIGKSVLAVHRLIYVYMTGENIDELEIDHRNRNSQDNRWVNLVKRTRSSNQLNTGQSCIRIRQRSKPYQARITVLGETTCRSFYTLNEAQTFVKETKEEILK